jgi:cellulose synthase/poly-beta-1,6-N-acetylglucosamine synthase-like glycosyltransferase
MKAQLKYKTDLMRPTGVLAVSMTLIFLFVIFTLMTFPIVLSLLSLVLLFYILLCSIRYSLSVVALRTMELPRVSRDLPFVTVIVPAYNEAIVLKRTIPAMLSVEYPEDRIEFLYVYEGKSTDETEEVIMSFAKKDQHIRPLLRNSDKGGKAAATNFGIRHAKGEIIASYDADHSVSSDAIKRAVSWLEDPKIKCAKGRCRGINKRDNPLAMVSGIERDIVERLSIPSAYYLGGFSTFGGGHAYFKKELFEDLGLFDEEIMTEDIDYSVRLHMNGHQVICDPLIESWEEIPNSFNAWFHQRIRWARGWMQVWKKHISAVVSNRQMKPYEKLDVATTLSMVLGVVISIFLIPTMILNFLGMVPGIIPRIYYIIVVAFATLLPLILAIAVVYIDYKKDGIFRWLEIPFSLLIIPYFFLLVGVNWLAFTEEFIFRSKSVYVKTLRNETPHSKATLKKVNG